MAITKLKSLGVTYPLTTFSSTGIDDNADATAITIDSSENVGIGTTSPDRKLAVVSSQSIVGRLESSGSIAGQLAFSDANSSSTTNVRVGAVGDNYTIFTNNAERMRIDSSGNVGIGSTGNAKLQVFGPSASSSLGTYANSAAIISNNAGGYGISFSVTGSGTGYIQAQNFTTSNAYNLSLNSAGGNVGIGTTSPEMRLHVAENDSTQTTDVARFSNSQMSGSFNAGAKIYIGDNALASRQLELSLEGNGSSEFYAFVRTKEPGGLLALGNANNAYAAIIDSSSNFLLGTTSAIGSATNTADNFTFSSTSGYAWLSVSDAGGVYIQRQNDGKVLSFFRATSIVGSISVDSVSPTTNYNTTSDQRLKENIADASAGNIDDIRVRSFDWKDGGFHQSHGMIAQELVDVAPEAVTQGKTNDDMWQVDYSKLVPMMIKEIQDLRARVAQLEGA